MSRLFLLLVALSWANCVPVEEKDFFLFETEDGQQVKAYLKGLEPAAKGPIEQDVVFWHYLPGQEDGSRILLNCEDDCLSGFAPGAPLVLAAHGFSSSHTGGFGTNIRGGFGNRSEVFNLVFVNWAKRSGLPDYLAAVNNVPEVGEYVAEFVNWLVEKGVARVEETSFIGHSLGAHMASHVGSGLNGGKMKAIFALDPAGPLFGNKGDDEKIDPSDAQFVNVMHTSIDYLGMEEPRGHVDFYPNSGEDQPGCGLIDIKCSHSRSYHFLGESIGWPRAFPSCKCDSWDDYEDGRCACDDSVDMGWETPETAQGIYYLRTNEKSPYGQN